MVRSTGGDSVDKLQYKILPMERGDCLFVTVVADGKVFNLLVDGGSGDERDLGILRDYLRAELSAVGESGLDIHLLVATHSDNDHTRGLVRLLENAERWFCGLPPLRIGALWNNDPSSLGWLDAGSRRCSEAVPESVREGVDLTRVAREWGIRINPSFDRLVACPDERPVVIELGVNSRISVLGPTRLDIERVKVSWLEQVDKWKRRERLGSVEPSATGANMDSSPTNLASIILLLECAGHGILLMGDASGQVVVDRLRRWWGISEKAPMHVDVLKLPHHGSAANCPKSLFQCITADQYIVTSNKGLPDPATIEYLAEARKGSQAVVHFARSPSEKIKSTIKASGLILGVH